LPRCGENDKEVLVLTWPDQKARELELQDNHIVRLGSLKHLVSLQHLNLNRNRLKELDLSGLTMLVSINVCTNQLSRVPFSLPATLRFACASENAISELKGEEFAHLTTIDTLMLDCNNISSLPLELKGLTTLTLLDVRNNAILFVDEVFHSVPFFYGDPPSLIVPGLYLGNLSASQNRAVLLHLSVNAVVRAIDASCQPSNPFDKDFRYLWIDCQDTDEQDLRQHFDTFNKFVGEAIESGETVFVHCRQGKSRSATLVIAYLMVSRGWSANDALDMCRKQRVIIRPNPSFLKQLSQFEDDRIAFL
jgi:protein-tyrosine phosphatase